MNTAMTASTPIGQIAVEHPLATRVFARHRIDYCCGGGKSLGEVCRAKGLDPVRVLDEIRHEIEPADFAAQRWDEAPLRDLIDHILERYHRPLQEELSRLDGMAEKVFRVHGDKDPDRLASLVAVYRVMKAELEDHMVKEEQILFPMILRGQGAGARGPVSVMLREHTEASAALQELRALTDNYVAPADACTTWRALWHGLAALERDLHEHIHLENNVLFPRALAS